MSAIDLPFLGQDAHLRRCAFSRYGEWKLALHHWHDANQGVLHLQLPFFPRYCPLQRSADCRRGLPI
jgi:hypothetical protein